MDDNDIIKRSLLGKLVIRDFDRVTMRFRQIFERAGRCDDGENADYIPDLQNQNRDKVFARWFCTCVCSSFVFAAARYETALTWCFVTTVGGGSVFR